MNFQDADKASMASNVQQAPFIKQLAANGMYMIFCAMTEVPIFVLQVDE